jgi:pimeloyl-ACP methyl ester carboxylesterase
MADFVLVPGAWLGAWVWSPVEAGLRARGHQVHPVTLAGLAERAGEATAATGLHAHVEDVVRLLTDRDLTDVVLVGHSYAGVVVTGVADRVPGRISRLVYLAGALLADGQSLFDAMGPQARAAMEAAAAAAGDPTRIPFVSDAELDLYYGEHGLSADAVSELRARATGHPIASFAERLTSRDPTAAALPRTYLHCTADGPAPVAPGQPGWDYAELDTGHWPMVTMPGRLADLLAAAAGPSAEAGGAVTPR